MKINKRDYAAITVILVLLFVVVSGSIAGLVAAGQVRLLKTDIQLLVNSDHQQMLKIIDLEDKLDEQLVLNDSYKEQITENMNNIDINESISIQNSVDIDRVSHEACETEFRELWVEVEYLRKKVK